MERLCVVLIAAHVALLACAFVFAGFGLLFPPSSDREIQASFVDTWEAHAFSTAVILSALSAMGVVSALLAWGGSRGAKRLAIAAVAFSISSAALFLAAHIELTERTTRLTGQTFGGFYGLF